MLSTRFSPVGTVLSDMQRMSGEFDRVLQLANGSPRQFGTAFPPMNVWESDYSIFLEVELPGFKMKDLDVSVDERALTIAGERHLPDVAEAKWRRQERGYGKFCRTIVLPRIADTENVQATFTDGVLQLEIAKREDAKPRRIEVKAH